MSTNPLPSLGLNGTGAQALLDEYFTAGHTIRAAIHAMQDLTVNGRDYSAADYIVARKRHNDRTEALKAVYNSIQEDYDALYEKSEAIKAGKSSRTW